VLGPLEAGSPHLQAGAVTRFSGRSLAPHEGLACGGGPEAGIWGQISEGVRAAREPGAHAHSKRLQPHRVSRETLNALKILNALKSEFTTT
jgi:hypothetical protein